MVQQYDLMIYPIKRLYWCHEWCLSCKTIVQGVVKGRLVVEYCFASGIEREALLLILNKTILYVPYFRSPVFFCFTERFVPHHQTFVIYVILHQMYSKLWQLWPGPGQGHLKGAPSPKSQPRKDLSVKSRPAYYFEWQRMKRAPLCRCTAGVVIFKKCVDQGYQTHFGTGVIYSQFYMKAARPAT